VLALLRQAPEGFPYEWFRQVGGAAEYAQIRPDALPLPAAWVVRAADGVRSVSSEGMAFELDMGFDVVIAISNARGSVSGDMDEALLDYRRAVFGLLVGQFLEADVRPFTWKGGTVLEYTDGDLYWRDRYQMQAVLDNYLPEPPELGAPVLNRNSGETL
jgi:hypothetical protein